MSNAGSRFAVVVPIYRSPTLLEQLSLHCLVAALPAAPLYLLQPHHLDYHKTGFRNISIPDKHFSSLNSYARLMVNPFFYSLFNAYEFILVYQPDCLIFADRVCDFLQLNCDYVAPPFLASPYSSWPSKDQVGIGGFSLRRVASHLETLRIVSVDSLLESQLEHLISTFNAEDVFWGVCASQINPNFSVSSIEVSLRFGFDGDPKPFLARTSGLAPLGCHHWQDPVWFRYYCRLLPFRRAAKLYWIFLAYLDWAGKNFFDLPLLVFFFLRSKSLMLLRSA